LPDGWDTDEATATAWVNGFVEMLHNSFKAGESVTLPGIGGFSTRPSHEMRNEKSPARDKWRKGLNTYILYNNQVILENIHR